MIGFRSIRLHTKTALIFTVALAAVIFSCLFVTRYFFLFSINELEDIEIRRASQQGKAVIQNLATRQEDASYDWAFWDETYQLLAGNDPDYVERNFSIDTLDALGLDLMAVLQPDQKAVAVKTRGEDGMFLTQLILSTESISRYLTAMQKQLDSRKTGTSGLLKIGRQVWIVSLAPVRDSSGQSEMVGWMLWGQHLTQRFPADYQDILMADNALLTNFSDFTDVHQQLKQRDEDDPVYRVDGRLHHFTILHDNVGNEVAVLKTTEERVYYQKGNNVFFYLIISMLLVMLIISLLSYWLFKDKVSKRFVSFEQDIHNLLGEQLASADEKKDEFERITEMVQSLAYTSNLAHDQLKDTLRKFDALYHGQSMGMILINDQVIVDVNPATLELLGYQRDQLLGNTLDFICGGSNEECAVEQFYQQLQLGRNKFETFMRCYDDTEIACFVEATVLQDKGQKSVMIAVQDISEQKQQAELIQTLTQYDPISGLLNRPTLLHAVRRQLRQLESEQTFSIVYFNASRLKEIDEVYGHDMYDACVRHLADTLKRYFIKEDVGRISEQEFAVCYTGPQPRLERMASHILSLYRHKITLNDIEFDIGLKGALLPSSIEFESVENMAHCGHYAVTYNETPGASSLIVVTPELFEQTQESLLLNRDIAAALKNREFIAHYQPIVKAETGQVVGFEALARWQHPVMGMISPAVFIPLAEERKLIVELGEQILDQACQFLHTLQSHSNELRRLSIHVNISSPHFHHNSLLDTLQQVMERYQLAPGQLVLELTESILLGVEEETLQRMEAVKANGVQLALDDFGTGYSSFSSLCNFPLDIVKLDKSYIDRLETNQKAKSLIRNIIHMSQELGMTTVAEGVENSAQLRKLNVWNVDEIQGYLFYKPMSAEQALRTFGQR